MLDDYKDNKFYDYATNLQKYYHAYLFEVDNLEKSYPLILAFAKMIICKKHYTNLTNCSDCNICHLIDEGYYSDLKVIEPDGISIKKEAIENLQKELSLKSVNDTNQVYIIKNAEKLNLSSANSLLKFIEEPAPGLYGILITENRKQILPTIFSRCNLISLKGNSTLDYSLEEVQPLLDFLKTLNSLKENFLPEVKSMFLDKYENRDKIIASFNLLEKIIDTKIKINYQIKPIFLEPFCDIIKTNLEDISNDDLIFYLSKIVQFKNKLINISNLNINLFMDKFVIEMSKCEVN